jgi:hypothetical protein
MEVVVMKQLFITATILLALSTQAMAASEHVIDEEGAEAQLALYAEELEMGQVREALTMLLLINEVNDCRTELYSIEHPSEDLPTTKKIKLKAPLAEAP